MALRIAHVCRTGWPAIGGLETAVHGLARALQRRGHDSWVVTLEDAGPAGTHEGVRYERVRRAGPRRYPTGRGLLAEIGGADVVHVHGIDGLADKLVVARALGRAPPVGISTHGGYLHTPWMHRVKQVWLRTGTRLTLSRADAVWFTSAADRERMRVCAVPGRVLENGVDVESLRGAARAPVPGTWLVPGRVDVHKGLDDLIRVLGVLARRGIGPARVDLVGPDQVPGLRHRLLALARDEGVDDLVRFVGPVDKADLRRFFTRCELVVLPSRREGFGLAAVESMAAGVPVALADIAAYRGRVRPGIEGWLVPFSDPEAAADLLAAVPVHDLESVGARAAVRARRWSWGVRVRAFEGAYSELTS